MIALDELIAVETLLTALHGGDVEASYLKG